MGVSLSIRITELSYDAVNNSSTVRSEVVASWGSGSYDLVPKVGVLTIGENEFRFTANYNTEKTQSGSKVIYTIEEDFEHEADGTKVLRADADWNGLTATKTISLTSIPKQRSLSINASTNCTVQAFRDSSPRGKAPTGEINAGTVLYDADVIRFEITPKPGYYTWGVTVNGAKYTSGKPHTVNSDVALIAHAAVRGVVHIGNEIYQPFIGGEQYIPMIYQNGEWVIQS